MPAKQKIQGLQALRGVAALMVLIGHALAEAEHFFDTQLLLQDLPWTRGVDLFFVISGFIIVVASTQGDNGTVSSTVFLRRRFIRVVPLYWFFTTLMVATLIILPSGVKETKLDIYQILSSYTFIPYERYDGRIAPVLSLGWTLNYEIFFYVVFSLLLGASFNRAIVLLVGIFSSLVAIGFIFDFEWAPLVIWTNSIILEFVFGALIGYYFVRFGKLPKVSGKLASFAGIAIGFALLILFDRVGQSGNPENALPRFFAAGVPSAIIVAAAVLALPDSMDARVPKWMTDLGDWSYSLYLSHRFVLRPMTIIWQKTLPMTSQFAAYYVVAACVVAMIGAIFVFYVIERPFLRLFRKRPHVVST